jgi:hypothetical protein
MPSTGPLWLAAYTFATVENDIASAGELGAAVRDQNLVSQAGSGLYVLFWVKKKKKQQKREVWKEMFTRRKQAATLSTHVWNDS